MKTLRLTFDHKRRGFKIGRTGGFIPADSPNERQDVIDYLAHRICDNPSLQAKLGILGESSIDIR
jgi:hypothetical protein